MSNTSKISNTALTIALLQRGINSATETLKSAKADLIALVGNEGETIETTEGKVTVTQQTQDRPSGKISYSLDQAKFLELDPHVRANLIKKGIVKEGGTTIKGQAPIVKVALK